MNPVIAGGGGKRGEADGIGAVISIIDLILIVAIHQRQPGAFGEGRTNAIKRDFLVKVPQQIGSAVYGVLPLLFCPQVLEGQQGGDQILVGAQCRSPQISVVVGHVAGAVFCRSPERKAHDLLHDNGDVQVVGGSSILRGIIIANIQQGKLHPLVVVAARGDGDGAVVGNIKAGSCDFGECSLH